MRKENVLVVVAIPVLLEYSRNLIRAVVVVENLWVSDIPVIGNTAALSHFFVIS